MPIPIEGLSTNGRGDKPSRRIPARGWKLLALGQLFITLPVVVFLYLLVGHFRYQPPPFYRIGAYHLAVEFFESVRSYRFPVLRWLGFNSDFPELYIDISQNNYRKLEFASQNDLAVIAGKEGEILRREVEVPATFRLDGESVPVKIRLKGERKEHFKQPDHWSFRVDVRGNRTIFGMEGFSLQKPVLRNYAYEWFFQQILKREGLIGLRYQFMKVHVNGKSQGIYALEEGFEKRLIESNERRDGPILKFSKEVPSMDSWNLMAVEAYEERRWSEENPELLQQAIYLMEGFRDGRLRLAEAFDVRLLARFYALVDLLEMWHGALPKSIKFYYNPITLKLEPIGFDLEYYGRKFPVLTAELSDFRQPRGYSMSDYYDAFFGPDIRDKREFFEAYVRELERVSQPAYLDAIFQDLDPELDRILDFLYSEVPFIDTATGHPLTTGVPLLFHFAKRKFYERQYFIRSRVRPRAAVVGYLEQNVDGRLKLAIGNAQKLPIEVVEVVYGGLVYRPGDPLLLNGKPRYEPMDFETFDFEPVGEVAQIIPARNKTDSNLGRTPPPESAIRYRLPGSSSILERELYGWFPFVAKIPDPTSHHPNAPLGDWPFLEVDAKSKLLTIRPGSWTLTRDLTVPAGYTLRGGANTMLDLQNGSRITSYSPIEFEGGEFGPLTITSSDGTGSGLIVLDAEGRSLLRHVRFEKLTVPANSLWQLTSSVTFYHSDVTIEDTVFEGNDSEDALNIVRSNFEITRARFSNTRSDAFDSDFSDGRIDASTFTNIGNDAIDVSGTQITVREVNISNAGDKALSVGEASRMEGEYIKIQKAKIAVAVKDSSNFDGMTMTVMDCDVGFALFQKKPEFGPASASIWRTVFVRTRDTHWLEQGSNLLFDGSPVAANKADLASFLYAKPPEADSGEVQAPL